MWLCENPRLPPWATFRRRSAATKSWGWVLLLIAFAIVAGFAVAGALVRLGLIGRATDDHPVCRACRFDLYNLPPDRTACPECGSDLRAPRAVRVGNRTRRPAPLYAGLALLLLSTLAACLVGTIVARGIDTYRWLPDAWVERDTRSPLRSQQTRAWAELKRRFLDNGLSSKRTARLVDAALTRQAVTNTAWLTEIGDFVEAVHKAHALPQDKWVRYARQGIHVVLRARKQVGRADPIVPELVEDGDRVAADSLLLANLVDVNPRGDLVVERDPPPPVKPTCEQMGTGSWVYGVDVEEDRAAMSAGSAGKHTVEVSATVEVLEGSEMDPMNAKPVFREQYKASADFELVDRQTVEIELVPDTPQLRKQMEAVITMGTAERLPDANYLFIRYSQTAPPVPTAFRVTVRQGDHQWKDVATCEAGHKINGAFLVPAKGFDGDKVDVILEPDVNVARETIDTTRMWNGRMEFKDIPILPLLVTKP